MNTFAMNIAVPATRSAIKQVAANNNRLHQYGHAAHVETRGGFKFDLILFGLLAFTTTYALAVGEVWCAVITVVLAGGLVYSTWGDFWMLRRIPGVRVEGIAVFAAEQFSSDLAQAVKYLTDSEQEQFVQRGLTVAHIHSGVKAADEFRAISRDISTTMPHGVRLSHF